MTTHRILVFVFILVWYAIGLRWIWLYRRGNLFDWDEASYLSIAAEAAHTHEFGEWVRTIFGTYQSPATTGITAAIFSLFGIHPILGFLVPLTAAALTLFLIFSMGWRIGGAWMAWIALVLVATMPIFVDYSRTFNFAMGSTLATMAALYCLLRSDGMASLRWAALFGFCVGLMPLTRTMVLAYVPALILAALISSLGHENSWSRIARLAGAATIAGATTAVWLVPNWGSVWGYLLGFGYGEHSAEYGTASSLLHWDAWRGTLRYYLYGAGWTHSAILLVGATVTAAFAVRRSRGLKPIQILQKVAHFGLLGAGVLSTAGTVALASTPNHGTGFQLPLLSALTLVSAWGLTRASNYWQRGGIFVITVAILIAYLPFVDLRWAYAELRSVRIPVIGPYVITDGRGNFQRYAAVGIAGGQLSRDIPEPIDATTSREWQTVIAQTIEFVRQENQPSTGVALGFRNFHYNPGSLQLAQLSKYDYKIHIVTIDPTSLGKSEDAYFAWLTDGSASGSCLLFTSAGIINEASPVPDSAALASAARRANFLSDARWTLPDGRDVVAWRRNSDMCRKH